MHCVPTILSNGTGIVYLYLQYMKEFIKRTIYCICIDTRQIGNNTWTQLHSYSMLYIVYLHLVSLLAVVHRPTFWDIIQKRDVQRYSAIPYVCTLLNCMLWVVYGLPDVSLQILVVTINLSGCLIELIYISIYLVYAPKKTQVLHSNKVMTMFKLLFNLLFIWVTHRSTIKLQELTANSHWNNAHYQLLWSDAILMSIVADKSFKAPGSNDGFFHFGCRHRPRSCPWQTPTQAHHRRFLCCVFSWDVCISAHGHGRSSLLHPPTHAISSKWIGIISHMRDSQWTVLIITICSSLYKKEI